MTCTTGSRPALALGGLTAAIALLVGLTQANAQAPVPAPPLQGAGSFPGSFIVPGTNTSLHIGGVIQIDIGYDMSSAGTSPGARDNATPTAIALEGAGIVAGVATNHGIFRETGQFTRPNIETRTPTAYGELKTFFELDFAGSVSSNSAGAAAVGSTQTSCCGNFSAVRVKQVYGTLGPWLFGQTVSNYADLDALPDVLDAAGLAGGYDFPGNRLQPQIRYTFLLPQGISAGVSIESFQSSGTVATTPTATATTNWNNFDTPGMGQRIPAVTAKGRIDQPWGHAALAAAVAQERFVNVPGATGVPLFAAGVIPVGGHEAKWGYKLSQSGHVNTIGRDKITWNIVYGQGAAQFDGAVEEVGGQWEEGLVCSVVTTAGATNRLLCSQPRTFGIEAGYSHFWTDEWRSGVELGYDQVSKPNAAAAWGTGFGGAAPIAPGTANGLGILEKHHYSAHANVMWTPVPAMQLGIEYQWYHRVVWSGAHGSHNRIAGQALFKF